MSDPISRHNKCRLNPAEKETPVPRRNRFNLKESHFNGISDDAHMKTSDIKYADRHDYLVETNAAYRTFHYISVIFGAHDERTPEKYRGGLTRILAR